MARQPHRYDICGYSDRVLELLELDAKMLAKQHGRDPRDVREIVHRLAEGTLEDSASRIGFSTPRLDSVLRSVSASRVLALLKNVGAKRFRELMGYIHFLENIFTPLYSLEELGILIKAFRSHLLVNTELMEDTGYPGAVFYQSKWLDSYLNKLYFTKTPHTMEIVDGRIEYGWTAGPAAGREARSRTYGDAEVMPSLKAIAKGKSIDITALEKNRVVVHEAKLRILKRLHESLKTGSFAGLWVDCLDILVKRIDRPTIDLLRAADQMYERHWPSALSEVVFPDLTGSGGIGDLLWVVGHVEAELTTQSHARIRDEYSKYVSRGLTYDSRLLTTRLLRGVVFDNSKKLKQFVKMMKSTSETMDGFWEEFHRQVGSTIASEFGQITVDRQYSAVPSISTDVPGSTYTTQQERHGTRKPYIILNQRTRCITIVRTKDRRSFHPKARQATLIKALSYALEECQRKYRLRQPVIFDREKMCRKADIRVDTKMAHIFRGTELWPKSHKKRLIRSVSGKNMYTLDVDLKESRIHSLQLTASFLHQYH